MKHVSIVIAGIIMLLSSCSDSKVPDGILEPEKMQDVYWDFIRADLFANEFIVKDSSKNIQAENVKLQQQVFELHKVSKETFYKSYDYYLKHQDLMKEMIDTMLVRQQKKTEKSKEVKRRPDSLKVLPVE